ncbi:MAG: response regulator [bacterium]
MNKHKILLIDDDRDMLTIGQQVVENAGFQFLSANTALEGFEKMKSHRPDVIILDYLLPDVKGDEFIRTIATDKSFEKVRSTPVVILTAWDGSFDEIRYLFKLGLWAYLKKPFGHKELIAVIQNVIELARARKKAMTERTIQGSHPGVFQEELQDSVNSIVGLSKSLLEGVEGELNERQQLDLMAIYNCGRKLLKKIDAEKTSKDVGPKRIMNRIEMDD